VIGGSRPRAVILVGGPARPYSRALRIARTLVDDGYDVEIAATSAIGAPDLETHGPVTVRRYTPSGPFAPHSTVHKVPGRRAASRATLPTAAAEDPPRRLLVRIGSGLARRARRALRTLRAWVLWPVTVRGWWATLDRELGPADVYHACGALTIAPALAAARRDRHAGRRPIVIYDAVDNTFESNNVLAMPGVLRRLHAARDRRWARAADGRTTVNDAIAARLAERWGVDPPVVVPNWPEPSAPGSLEGSNRIREALGLPPDMGIVLFQGRLSPRLGLEEAEAAVLRLDRACLVLLGFGRWMDRSRALDREPRFAGRHFTLPAVHPDDLPAWTASADVSLVPLPAISRNQRESTPNKFWESLLVGTPIVLGPGLDVMARIVTETRSGVVARSLEPDALAEAIATILEADPLDRAGQRRRVAALAAERYTWPTAAQRYRHLLRSLTVGDS
jgi:glycosyltransferase involved in cell wall biosynthesis